MTTTPELPLASHHTKTDALRHDLDKRILILDGAMGTMIQRYALREEDYHPKGYEHHDVALKGNNDLLPLSRPDVIEDIHRAYIQAGADIIETCTFGANAVCQKEYGLENLVEPCCRAAVRIAKKVVHEEAQKTHRQAYIAGSVGPTKFSLSIATNVDDPAKRDCDFDTLKRAYEEQMFALLDEGVDLLIIETIFDGLNAKAAACACRDALRRIATSPQKHAATPFPVIFSATLADAHGRLLNGQTFAAFVQAIEPLNPLAIGFNCGFGVTELAPFIHELAQITSRPICFYPNAGLPDPDGNYGDTPEFMASRLAALADQHLLNIVGGCCGTTPKHIRLLAKTMEHKERRPFSFASAQTASFAGLETLKYHEGQRILIAERTNVTGSKKFKRLVSTSAWDEAVTVARDQMFAGAQMLDICMDDAMMDGVACMCTFLRAICADPDVSKYPFVIDSSNFDIIRAAMREIPGRSLINSISLKNGEDEFLAHAREIKQFGHAAVVMAFDEQGQAATTQRRVEILSRAVNLLIQKLDFAPKDIALDPNILAIGTGMPEHDTQALSFIETCRIMRERFPGIQTIGGLSNLSFAFRGRDDVRAAIHTAFLEKAGSALSMVIANPTLLASPETFDPELYARAKDLVDAAPQSLDALLTWMAAHEANKTRSVENKSTTLEAMSPKERIQYAFTKGMTRWLESDIQALSETMSPLQIIEGPLMDAMNVVGERFGKAEMFLPEVVRAARIMKQAIALLKFDQETSTAKRKRILLATVFGDVHDIGKNIVSVVLSCNAYDIIDLGVMVPTQKIVETAIAENVDAVGLSGLITPSLKVMVDVAKAMHDAGLTIPLFVGGAATGDRHTALKIAPVYAPGVVAHIDDASQVPGVLGPWLDPATCDKTRERIQAHHAAIRAKEPNHAPQCSLEEARKLKPHLDYPHNAALDHAPRSRQIESFSPDRLAPHLVMASLFRAVQLTKHDEAPREAYHAHLRGDFHEIIRAATALRILQTKACYQFVPAHPENETIICRQNDEIIRLPGIRALQRDLPHYALADFLAPDTETPVCLFALTCPVQPSDISRIAHFLTWDADYVELLTHALATELVSAACDLLHQSFKLQYGHLIRPAFGYPIAPDHALKAPVLALLHAEDIGIALTPSYMMTPLASICGMTIFHPDATLFKV